MNYKRIIRPSELQKEWNQKTRKQSIWTKQYHLPTPVAVIIICIALFIYRVPIITFITKSDIPLPTPIIRIIEIIVKNNPNDYDFTIKETLS